MKQLAVGLSWLLPALAVVAGSLCFAPRGRGRDRVRDRHQFRPDRRPFTARAGDGRAALQAALAGVLQIDRRSRVSIRPRAR